ncbi:MAG: guanylate kinase [Kribbellaceae bacterium]|jgi:guanylate kinase|nr:guanylate kinase [Kribbellaceae bacterium]
MMQTELTSTELTSSELESSELETDVATGNGSTDGARDGAQAGAQGAQDVGGARLTVLAGPTAVGKGTVAADIRERFPEIWISVSATTRKARPNEVHGVHYLFVSDEEFDRMIGDDELLEWAVVHKAARYGTPRQPVLDKLAEGRPALLEIDLQGARQVRETMPEAHFVFLAPPSWDELVRRLVGRGTETPEERERRLETATLELASEKEFDVTIVNASVREAADQLVKLIRSPHISGKS